MKMWTRLGIGGLALWMCAALPACAPRNIQGSTVAASDANVAVWDVIQRYRRALEERDIDALMNIISREYFDNAATTDNLKDDYGYHALEERMLPILQENVKTLRIDLRLKEIRVSGQKAVARFEQQVRFLYSEGGDDNWETLTDFNELAFAREGDHWRITSGL